PFAGDNTVSVALLHIQSEPQPVRELVPTVQYSLDCIVQKCMQKRPENRYLSASELIVDLKRSVMNPDGDFVRITAGVVSDSPTKNMTQDELAVIKSAAKSPVTRFEANQQPNSQVLREEEEELDGTDTKWDKMMVFVVSGVVIVCMAVVIFAVVKFMNIFGPDEPTPPPTPGAKWEGTPTIAPTDYQELQTVRLQNVVGRMVDDAKELLLKQSDRFTILDGDTDYSDEYPAGMVISQYPLGGVDVALDEEIKLVVSAGPEMITVPDFTLYEYTNARVEAENDFKVRVEFENSSTIESNLVIRTVPARNELLAKGSELVLVVSRGEKATLMPNLLGMTLEGAEMALTEAELELGDVTYGGSPTYGEGLVAYQSETVNNMLPVGTVINIQISTGIVEATPTPEPTPEPTAEPTPEPSPSPTPTPEPIPMWEIAVNIPYNPLNVGDVAWVYFELQTASGTYLLYDNDEVSYDELSIDTKTFSFKQEDMAGVSAGSSTVCIYINGTPAVYANAQITETTK
ncbi:MAG: PASTA domain-containing protein, partial [Lachnospiraceae bacterium]|nr:PASTA domain-containing protein [Lachnospiraceae bacterium]